MWICQITLTYPRGGPGWLRALRQGVAVLVLSSCCLASAQSQSVGRDGIEEFRKALNYDDRTRIEEFRRTLGIEDKRIGDGDQIRKFADQYRKDTLEKLIKTMPSIGDRSQILLLSGWNPLRAVDETIRKKLIEDFTQQLLDALNSPDPGVVTSTCSVIAQTFAKTEKSAREQGDLRKALHSMVAPLKKLVSSADQNIQAAAALALGRIKPKLTDLVSTIRPLVQPSRPLPVRQAAIQGLRDYVGDLVVDLTSISGSDLDLLRDYVADFKAAGAIVRLLGTNPGVGLADADLTVRQISVGACQGLAYGCRSRTDRFPVAGISLPPARQLTTGEEEEIGRIRLGVGKDLNTYVPLFRDFQDSAPALANLATSVDPVSRFGALRTFEDLAIARTRLRQYRDSVSAVPVENLPPPKEDKKPNDKEKDKTLGLRTQPTRSARFRDLVPVAFLEQADPEDREAWEVFNEPQASLVALVAVLQGNFPIDNRLRALTTIEASGQEAVRVGSVLIQALCDRNNFVRWAAARTLGKLAPKLADGVVPALIPLLRDPEIEVRVAAATALEKFGGLAQPAIAALTEVVSMGDAEVRIAAMKALVSIGASASSAVPEIAKNLTDTNSRIRIQAALSLGRFGPLAAEAAPALRQILNDPDLDVRKDASDALIKVLGK